MQPATLRMILQGDAKKGDVLGTARIAGIMAAKRTHELIPLCHPLLLTKVSVDIEADESLPGLRVTALARVTGKTGVEMEALTAASVACLTIYDMAKAVGSRHGDFRHQAGRKVRRQVRRLPVRGLTMALLPVAEALERMLSDADAGRP